MSDDPRRLYPYRFARWLIPRLPKRLAYWIAARGADIGWLTIRRARAAFEHNQRRALGPGAAVLHQRFVLSGLVDETGRDMGRTGAMLIAVLVARAGGWQATSLQFSAVEG